MSKRSDPSPDLDLESTDDVVPASAPAQEARARPAVDDESSRPAEIGGQKGPEPTRYGDWEKGGRCTDF